MMSDGPRVDATYDPMRKQGASFWEMAAVEDAVAAAAREMSHALASADVAYAAVEHGELVDVGHLRGWGRRLP